MKRLFACLILLVPVFAYGQGTTIQALPLRGSPQGTDLVWCQVPAISDNSCTLASILNIHETAYAHVTVITPFAETILAAPDAAAVRSIIGVGAIGQLDTIPDSTYIDAGAIDYDRIQAVTPARLLGRGDASGGPPEELLVGANCSITGTTFNCAGGGAVDSVFGRQGDVVAFQDDYTWGQIDKTVSDIADITTRAHGSLTNVGTNTHAQIDTHIADQNNPHNTVIEGKDEGFQQLPAIDSIDCTGTAITCSAQPGNELRIDVTAGSGGGDVILSGSPSVGELTIWATPPAVTGDPQIHFDTTNKLLTVGPQAGSFEGPSQLGVAEFTREASNNLIVISAAGLNHWPGVNALYTRGTYAAKEAVQADDVLYFMGGRGYNGTAYDSGSSTAISFRAQEDQTAVAEGSYITLETTASGSTSRQERMRINEVGISVGTGDILFNEKLDFNCTPAAGTGCLFLDDTTPTSLVFIDDTGARTTLGAGGGGAGDVLKSGTPVAGQVAAWINDNTIEGRDDISLQQFIQTIRSPVVDPPNPWTPAYAGEGIIPVTGLTKNLTINTPTGSPPIGRVWMTFSITASGGTRTIDFSGYQLRGDPNVTSWNISDGDTEEFYVHTDNSGVTWFLIGEDDTVAGGVDNTPWGAAWLGQTAIGSTQDALHAFLSLMDSDYDGLVDGLDTGAVDNSNEVTDGVLTLGKFSSIVQYTILGNETAGSNAPNDFGVADVVEKLTPAAGDFLLGWSSAGVLSKFDVGNLPGGAGAGVDSFNARTGAVVPAANDYSWAQINKTVSNLADITTRSHTSLTDIGTNTHTDIDAHLADNTNPHSTSITNIGSGTLADLNSALIDVTLEDPNLTVTAARVGAASPDLDDVNATVQWENAASMDANGNLLSPAVGATSPDLDDTDASVQWENAAAMDASGNLTAAGVGTASPDLDDTSATVLWQNANALDASGDLVANSVSGGAGGPIVDGSVDANDINETSDYTFTGTIGGAVGVTLDIDPTVDLVSAANAVNALRVNSDDDPIAYTLPPVGPGLNVCFLDNSASGQVVTINPDSASNRITLNGTDIALGTAIASSGTRGEFICLIGLDTTSWLSMGIGGTWN